MHGQAHRAVAVRADEIGAFAEASVLTGDRVSRHGRLMRQQQSMPLIHSEEGRAVQLRHVHAVRVSEGLANSQ